jgi:PAS domain S-box-containing protein
VFEDIESVLVVANDRTDELEREREQTAVDAALRESEERYRLLFDGTPLAIAVFDSKTFKYLAVNRKMTAVYGYSREEFLAMTVIDLKPPGDVPKMVSNIATARVGSQGHIGIVRHRRKDGAMLDIDITSHQILIDGRKCSLAIAIDVTDRRRVEEQRSLEKSILAAQNEASPDGILVIDPAGKIMSFNQRFVEMWRISPEVVESRSDERALGSVIGALVDPQAFLAKVRHLYDHPDETSRDDVQLKDGRVFDRHSSPLRGEQGEDFGRIWFFRDVTADRRADEQMRRSERLSLLGSLASGVAHEINNPLAYLLSNSEMTRDDLFGLADNLGLPAAARATCRELADLLAESHDGLLHIKQVVASLQTLSRPSGAASQLIDLPAVAQTAVTLASERARETNVKIATEICTITPVPARREEVAQILLNLVLNAIDASSAGGTVVVGSTETTDHVELHVHDAGRGIPADTQPHVFDPFFTTKPHGTGLGLAISQRIAHELGGTLTFTSTSDAGTTFRLRLPKRATS